MSALTAEEIEIVKRLGEAWDAYLNLPIEHPADRTEFCSLIHRAQEKVLSRAGRRQLNSGVVA